jgi:PST family polysaccharide transporter
MAFFGSYVFHVIMIYFVVRTLFGFKVTAATRHALALFVLSVGAIVAIVHLLPLYVATGSALVLITALGAYSLATLITLVPNERLPRPLRRLLALIQNLRRA